ncbi:ABC transporter substrate-binding protein [Elstera cyanobacteriorum]|uniref:Sugar ABC transporter substrate-binding protein n=1 Tax=Elstera cyanobacteriorum TaxID=2022747 RepID=A0A255XYK1_9PROT|nr:extracellular solute-binding protein [Elstera cyanobacteriorum]OYQ21961.1 sugar ABC transporter substrate-binding protein [Elstera cyanobacteriorum]GGA02917.1 ABC transporter substrate-binding protein [Elstera cyanobacteriorum]
MSKFLRFATTAFFAVSLSTTALAGTLVINSDQSDPAPRKGMEALIEKFKKENPDIDVKLNVFDKESYKTSIRTWLSGESPDVVYWYAGERMKFFVDRKLFEDVSDVWAANKGAEAMPSTVGSVTVDGKQYGVPYTYYNWGIYYRKDLFEKAGIQQPPKTWAEFLDACAKLKASGVAPIVIGSKALWPTAGWFDYLNLRVNGMDYHMKLMAGQVPYTDKGVKDVFDKWAELIRPGYFIENHASYTWQESQPLFYQGKGAMYLIGNFITPEFPADVRDKMDFFQFPKIADQPMYEDAPTDTVHIPARAKNKVDAKKFLAFYMRPDVQTELNSVLRQIPTNKDAKPSDDRFLQAGYKMLSAAAGTAQFYDRDTDPSLAQEGMKAFQEFMIIPDRGDEILTRLEARRKQVFKQ